MSSTFNLFDRRRLSLLPVRQRNHDLNISSIMELRRQPDIPENLRVAAKAILRARQAKAPVIFMMGAHVIRSGVQRYIIDLMERGFISALAGNGACAVHDYELALLGATTESVARYIKEGQFGLWQELSELNSALSEGSNQNLGAGESVGRLINSSRFPHKDISLFNAAWRLKKPFTIHIGIGNDIIHQLPNCDGAALGKTSYTDFLIFAALIEKMEKGVFCNMGSAVTGPEVFLKALAMVRNATGGESGGPRRFTTLVSDLHDLPADLSREADRTSPLYYYRPWKTILIRSINDGGKGLYVKGPHSSVIPGLWSAIEEEEHG